MSETYLELRGRRFGRLKIWKIVFIWQEATENAFGSGEITVGEEEETEQGMRFSTLEIRED